MIQLTREPIDPEKLRKAVEDPSLGGVVVFAGEVRSFTRGKETSKLVYEAYEEMALPVMKKIACEAIEKWPGKIAMVHRVGELLPGEIAVVTAAACPHRADAFACCRFLIDKLKEDVPIWKQEIGPDGSVWVEGERA